MADGFGAPPLFCYERAAAGLFGVAKYGVYVNAFVRRNSSEVNQVRSTLSQKCPRSMGRRVVFGLIVTV